MKDTAPIIGKDTIDSS